MSEICLHFNLAQRDTYKVAKFKDPNTKNKYVDAEYHDSKCIQSYLNYQAAKKEQRQQRALELDQVRFAFYERWKKRNNVIELVRNNQFEEDDPA